MDATMKRNFSILSQTALLPLLLLASCATDNSEALRARAELRTQSTPYTPTAFITAASKGDIPTAKLFLSAKTNVNISADGTALIAAVKHKQPEMVKFLLDNGADVNVNTSLGTALITAVRNGDFELAELLLDHKAKVDTETEFGTALFVAAQLGHSEIIELLINRGAKVDRHVTPQQRTALMRAAEFGQTDAVDMLLEKEADREEVDANKHDALYYATMNGHAETATLLADKDERLAKEKKASQALLRSLARNDVATAKILIEKGANINAKAYGQMPLLNWTIKNGFLPSAKFLLESGIDTTAEDQDGKIALDYAIITKNDELIKKLTPAVAPQATPASPEAQPEKSAAPALQTVPAPQAATPAAPPAPAAKTDAQPAAEQPQPQAVPATKPAPAKTDAPDGKKDETSKKDAEKKADGKWPDLSSEYDKKPAADK